MNRVGKIVPPKRQIIKDISLSFFPGAKIGLLGLNGSGKSTVLRIMAGLDKDIIGEATPMPGLHIGAGTIVADGGQNEGYVVVASHAALLAGWMGHCSAQRNALTVAPAKEGLDCLFPSAPVPACAARRGPRRRSAGGLRRSGATGRA